MGRSPTNQSGTGRLSAQGCLRPVPLPGDHASAPDSNYNGSMRGDVKSRTTAAIRAARVGAIAVYSTVSVGCYGYTPIDPQATPSLGTAVRVRLTDAGAVSLAPHIGNRIEMVDGGLVAVADTAVTLSVTQTTDRLGNETPWRGEQVAIPRAMVSALERRTLDRGKSYLVGGITAGVVALAAIGFTVAGNSSGGTTVPGGTPK